MLLPLMGWHNLLQALGWHNHRTAGVLAAKQTQAIRLAALAAGPTTIGLALGERCVLAGVMLVALLLCVVRLPP